MKSFSKIRKHRRRYKAARWMSRHPAWLHKGFGWIARHTRLLQRILKWIGHLFRFLRVLKYINPFRYIKKIDWYIIRKFIGTYFFSIALIISISIVFDVNENLAKFTQYHAPLRAIVFDYYANFIPYFANMLATGISFKRLLRPYMFTCVLLAGLSYYLSAYVIPHGTVIRQNFETMYKNKKKQTAADNVQLQVGPGVIAYIQHYDDTQKQGYGFCLDRFKDKKLISHLTAMTVQYDTISDSKFHWKLSNWKIRQLKGLREHITTGATKDTIIQMEPMDLVYSKGQQETFTSPALRDYISKQINRGSGNVVQYEVEYHKRIASSFASFILTIIGASLSARKRKGGMGMYLGIGLALSFTYIMLQTVSASFAVNAGFPPVLAAWMPNLIFIVIALICYRQAPN